MPREGALSGDAIEEIVKTAARLHANPEIVAKLVECTKSCWMWGKAMESLFDSLDHFYYPIFGRGMEQQHWDKIEQALMEGKAIFAQVKLAPVGDHTFTIVAEDGRAYILHAWQGEHGLRAERSMPIPEMMAELKKLTNNKYNGWFRGTAKIREARARLWGQDHMGPTDMGTSSKRRITFSSIASGEPKKPLIENGEVLERLSNELSAWKTASSELAASADAADETPATGDGFLRSPEFAVGFAAALGFVLGAGVAIYNKADWEEVLEEGIKSGLAVGIGEGAGIAVGGSVIRSNAAAGAVMFGISYGNLGCC